MYNYRVNLLATVIFLGVASLVLSCGGEESGSSSAPEKDTKTVADSTPSNGKDTVGSTDKADGTDATDSTDSTDETDSTDSTDKADTTDGTDGTDGTDKSDSTDNTDSTDSTTTIELTDCKTDDDCEGSANCVSTQNGGVCSAECTDNCPAGYSCKSVTLPGAAASKICVPNHLSACFPCMEDKDCTDNVGLVAYTGARCIPSKDGSGSFCGGACEDDAGCNEGYSCTEVTIGDESVKQCTPTEGQCKCSALAEGYKTSCSNSNDIGTCKGERACTDGALTECSASTPSDEVCDGLDNDCNEEIDDKLTAPDADKVGGVCVGAVKVCSGTNGWTEPDYSQFDTYEADETACDGKDNDCDGDTDEKFGEKGDVTFTDTDGTTLTLGKDCGLGACAGGKVICNTAGDALLCSTSDKASTELCDGKDNDCDPNTADGASDPKANVACDGDDADTCLDGQMVCKDAQVVCEDPEGELFEYCDGVDNDCDDSTPDGSNDPKVGTACDGDDADKCANGKYVCDGGALKCEDTAGNQPDICDGKDNDCDLNTPDGQAEATLGDACDGDGDADLCAEGKIVCKDGALVCNDPNTENPEICDGKDNDCNEKTLDGLDDPKVKVACDGDDSDTCEDGATICKDAKIVCEDPEGETADVCDGIDNDCNADTKDGSADPKLGQPCDGDDKDLCMGGKFVCVGGSLKCDDTAGNQLDVCDGKDNDCNDQTPDGADDEKVGKACDGDGDLDLCEEGKTVCTEGKITCDDPNDENIELCDGLDNDCNSATLDGSGDDKVNVECDGDDSDLCTEGLTVCQGDGTIGCTDTSDDSLDICDGQDNDCNEKTADGADEKALGSECDGDDADLCNEGQMICAEGKMSCNDANTENPDVCDGQDNDCDETTADGSGDKALGTECDGDDDDLCKEGKQVCTDGKLACDDPNDATPDVCDGQDNDCNDQTADGSGDADLGLECDGDDDDLCKEGKQVCTDGKLVCDDPNDATPDICDGQDNDCNENTPDGSGDPGLGLECDGDDDDLCKEGKVICNAKGKLACDDPNTKNMDICDGQDNDCNDQTLDGHHEPYLNIKCDGDGDADLCKEGKQVCKEGKMTCTDPNEETPDICDGQDNDCNDKTADGSGDKSVGTQCDGDGDTDLCKEGKFLCQDGKLTCDDPNDANPELCDGQDNDCNDKTADGIDDPEVGVDCDGTDTDKCKEGKTFCNDKAKIACNDPNTLNQEICDGKNNDCNSATPDGFDEETLNADCDGADKDLCKEGKLICSKGKMTCNDNTAHNKEVCDGKDNDCNNKTADGVEESNFDKVCDGKDKDFCAEGKWYCKSTGAGAAIMQCSDTTGDNKDLCDGKDNDCNSKTADGAHDPQIKGSTSPSTGASVWDKSSCDTSADADLCAEGYYVCKSAKAQCIDNSGNVNNSSTKVGGPDNCDGVDNDCNPKTADGSTAQSTYNQACSSKNTSLTVQPGNSKQLTGGFNNTKTTDWVRVNFKAPTNTNGHSWKPSLAINAPYKMLVYSNCSGKQAPKNCQATGMTSWTVSATWKTNPTNKNTLPTTVYVKIFRSTTTPAGKTCDNWKLTASQTGN